MYISGIMGNRIAGKQDGYWRDAANDRISLRLWFLSFLSWLVVLTVAAKWGLAAIEASESVLGWAVWIYALYAFYLSLCNVIIPAPTAWIVMLVASEYVAGPLGLSDHPFWRISLAATIGALATGMANLSEYHFLVLLLRWDRVAKIRNTRAYQWADRWFETNPFLILTVVGFLPIPVDVIRWLAIAARYSRVRYFLAYFIGRWGRYAIWALMAYGLSLRVWHIVAIQAGLVGLALVKIVWRWLNPSSRAVKSGVDPAIEEVSGSSTSPAQLNELLPGKTGSADLPARAGCVAREVSRT